MKFCRFRDFAVPVLGLSPRHPSIHEMGATLLVDSSFRAPHLPDAAGTRFCLGRTILRSIELEPWNPLSRPNPLPKYTFCHCHVESKRDRSAPREKLAVIAAYRNQQ